MLRYLQWTVYRIPYNTHRHVKYSAVDFPSNVSSERSPSGRRCRRRTGDQMERLRRMTDRRKKRSICSQQMGQQKLSIMQHNILSNSTWFDFNRVQWSSAKFCWQRFQFGTGTSGLASHASHPCWIDRPHCV